MFNAAKALQRHASASPKLPHVPELQALYNLGYHPRSGELIMIAGRSGAMKSTFALWLVQQFNLPTLYFSADMSGFQASAKLTSHQLQMTVDEIEALMRTPSEARRVIDTIAESNITFSFGTPITWQKITNELNAWIELYNNYPAVIVIDNLMDIDGCESDYQQQQYAMQLLSDLSRETGSTLIVLHHATDKGEAARRNTFTPPPRNEIKNGLSEKPEQILTVALDNRINSFNIAVVKQRMGYQDASATNYVTLKAQPELNSFNY